MSQYSMVHLTNSPYVFEEGWWNKAEGELTKMVKAYEDIYEFETTEMEALDGTQLFVMYQKDRGWRVVQTR